MYVDSSAARAKLSPESILQGFAVYRLVEILDEEPDDLLLRICQRDPVSAAKQLAISKIDGPPIEWKPGAGEEPAAAYDEFFGAPGFFQIITAAKFKGGFEQCRRSAGYYRRAAGDTFFPE